MDESTIWNLIDTYFQENPQALVRHHIDSYNQFFEEDIFQILRDMNPLKINLNMDESINDFRSKCNLYFGGKDGKRVYFGKPMIADPNHSHFMFPNEARLRNMTYAVSIHYDIEIEYERILEDNEKPTVVDDNGYILPNDQYNHIDDGSDPIQKKHNTPSDISKLKENVLKTMKGKTQTVKMLLEKVFLCKFPVMLQSKLCVLHNMPRQMRYSLGECKNDVGGYFIIDGKEKVIIPQETFGDNMINISKSTNEKFTYTLDIKSISENLSKPRRTLSISILAPTATIPYNNIGVFIPNAGNKPIPLFIVFRALGILSDKDIISFCTLKQPEQIPTGFIPCIEACIHDASSILTQQDAIKYISLFVKGRSIERAKLILADFFLPHIGELNVFEKAYFLGYLVNRLLSVATGLDTSTDRDNYKYKRVELIGPLLKKLFTDYYHLQQKSIQLHIETSNVYFEGTFQYKDIGMIIHDKYSYIFQSKRIVEEGIRKAFKGNWGAHPHTKIIGVVQDLNRLSHNSMLNHLRKVILPMDASIKLVPPRVLHGSQWGIIDPIDTPDGANIGLHKHLSLFTLVSNSLPREPFIEWIRKNTDIIELQDVHPIRMGKLTKVFVNGFWLGGVSDPLTFVNIIKLHRRHGLIPIVISVSFDYARNTILLSTDGGRLCRPIFYKDDHTKQFSFENEEIKFIQAGDDRHKDLWLKIITGFHSKNADIQYNPYIGQYYSWTDLYPSIDRKEHVQKSKALLEYIDTQESESSLIAMNFQDTTNSYKKYTHCEIHPSTTYGMMCNLINYVEHNPASRNSFSCGQSKQACSLYSTNYHYRMDKSGILLNNGQIPLVKSRYLKYINNEENPYGENAIVAIMCYTGYNVEDAILINEGSLKRGLFRTTYFTTYEAREERETKHQVVIREKLFTKTQFDHSVSKISAANDFDYSYLDENGIIRENVEVNERMILIGETEMTDNKGGVRDISVHPKKGQQGYVDKIFLSEDEAGQRIAKVRIRDERIPTTGDKFASRAGQKGTIGMIVPEVDMPFTKDGVRPDMIINPHALPSRMTIGQIIECIVGKACAMTGTFGDCTSFDNQTNKIPVFGTILQKNNFHSKGDEILYNGMNGSQLEASIFIGPTYYMRLKHMVKDKINYRARGPRTNLTRQPVSGRANDGGLRIGEMERDAVISHGMSQFLKESMMERADAYQLAICNHTGIVSIYNPSRDILLSPSADGPISYSGSLVNTGQIQVQQLSKYGRSFSIIQVPYAMKLLIQELQTIQVQMRIITEDNIHQIENMNFSYNLKLLTGDDTITPQMIIRKIKETFHDVHENPDVDKIVDTTQPEGEIDTDELSDPNVNEYEANDTNNSTSDELEEGELEEGELDSYDPDRNENDYQYQSPDTSRKNKKNKSDDTTIKNDKDTDMDDKDDTVSSYDPDDHTPYIYESPPSSINGGDGNGDGEGHSLLQTQTQDKLPIHTTVFYRGDTKAEREWTIENSGSKYYTISTKDLEGISMNDSIKIVSPDEIYLLSEISPTPPYPPLPINHANHIHNPPPTGDPNDPFFHPYTSTMPGGTEHNINITPIIKVFNHGNDMSIPDVQSPRPSSLPSPSPSSYTINTTNTIADTKAESTEEDGKESAIDFNNLIIKKT
jgi:DNA-directed RNA polymerase II subunit RPB2